MKLQEYTESKHNFEECMKCTVCTAYCPVLQVNPLVSTLIGDGKKRIMVSGDNADIVVLIRSRLADL